MSSVKLIRTNADNPDFRTLVRLLDADLAVKDGDDHDFYNQYNKLDKIKQVVLAYEDNAVLGCGAIKAFEDESMQDALEVKRMFTLEEARGKGIASKILAELENWTKELGYKRCLLETGKRQPDAIGLYKKNGYQIIENYGQYRDMDNSLCFEKYLF